MEPTVLTIQQLDKHFGKVHAVDHLSLTITKGQVFGILGPNGSGKTTTLGIILGVIAPDGGNYQWFGKAPSPQSRRKVGALLEQPNFLPYLSARENLKIACQIKGVDYHDIDRVLQIVQLKEREKSPFKTFSFGMKQRLGIASTLLGNPEVLILDEPTNGLDPTGIAEIRQLIKEIASTGKTILMASHLLDEIQKTCTDVMIIHQGKKIQTATVEEIVKKELKVEIEANSLINLKEYMKNSPIIESYSDDYPKMVCTLAEGKTSEDLNQYFFSKGVVLKRITPIHQSLEQHFLHLLNDD
ncbi:MAG: ABC transporter ATP-binding protein [Bacteroidetes bacterium]|nr:MAG: ABC transporter ATP-binding protein [Bacteroidota bacterium]PIE88135.1 MAG: ABC transporter ATP-binding protein [Bacteroidota bacterium]